MKKFVCLSVSIILLLLGCAKTPVSSQFESISSSVTAFSQSSQIGNETSLSAASDSDIKSNGDYDYEIVDNSVKIVEYNGMERDVVIPDMIDGLPVKIIGTCAFEETGVQKVVLPNHIQKIEGCAFLSSGLWELFIPDSVIEIGGNAFYWCSTRSFVLFYDNNPLVPQYAKENNILCFKRSEYNPVLDVELVGGKPLNDDQNLGISKEIYNRVSRRSMNDIEFNIDYILKKDGFYFIAFERSVNSEFADGDDLSQEAIKQKLTKISELLYQCGITEFDPKTINTGEVGCFDKFVTAALYIRTPEQLKEDVVKDSEMRFADDDYLYTEAFGLFDFIPNDSLVTGYSEQQRGIWYYPKELPKVTTEVLSFSGNLKDGNFILKVKFTDDSGTTCEKTFSYSLVQYDSVGGSNYRVILKGIQ